MSDADGSTVQAPPKVYWELKTLRQMGTHDMTTAALFEGLETYDFDAAYEWVVENPEKYERVVGTELAIDDPGEEV